MTLGKLVVLDSLRPMLPAMPLWFLKAMDEFNRTFTDQQKVNAGPSVRAFFVQRMALAQMRVDPAVVGNFRPIEDDQLEALVLSGETVNLSVLLKKANRFQGVLRTANQDSDRQIERRCGELLFEDMTTIPVVLFYQLRQPVDPLHPVVERVGLGEETLAGMDWSHTLWTEAGGASEVVVDGQPNLPLIPAPQVRLRKPAVAAKPNRVGTATGERKEAAGGKQHRRGRKGA